jgi:photosystem II stability/assembly factor-like uncharacterized protein
VKLTRSFFFNIILALVIASSSSCKRKTETWPSVQFDVGSDVKISGVLLPNDSTILAAGGTRLEDGYVFTSIDRGASWDVVQVSDKYAVTALAHDESGRLWAGCDFLRLFTSTDSQNWNLHWLAQQQPFHEEDRPAIRDFYFQNDSTWWFVGGEHYNEGVVYRTWDKGANWQFSTWEYEWRAIDARDGLVAIAGHGGVLLSHGGPLVLQSLQNDFFTGIAVNPDESLVVVSNQGSIWRSEDAGDQWEEIQKPSGALSRFNYNGLAHLGSHIIAVANDGRFSHSTDHGLSWSHYQLDSDDHLLNVICTTSGFYCGAYGGVLVYCDYPQ